MNNQTVDENNSPNQKQFNRIGIVVLVLLVVGAAVVLMLAAKQTDGIDANSLLKRKSNTDSRFDSNHWFLPNDEFLGFVEIPAGIFLMGSDPAIDKTAYANEQWSEEKFQGDLNLPQYYIGRFEVTVGQFSAFVADTQYKVDSRALKKADNFPVTYITWPDALAYCRWLENTLSHSDQAPEVIKKLLDDDWEITLPSEAQWEKAARGIDGRIYPWGNNRNASLTINTANIDSGVLKSVGTAACDECSYGLADMSGNVWEFTRSPYRPYPFSESIDSTLLSADALYVMRGGSYSDDVNNARAAVRGGVDPGVRQPNIGFRIALQQKITR